MDLSFACPDWEERLRTGRVPMAELPVDAEAADRALGVFDALRLPDVAGTPALAEAAGDWFRQIVRVAFGSPMGENGARAVRELFVLVPKKNGKTTYSAAIALTALLLNKRPRARLLIVGPTQNVADTAFSQAVGMIQADPVGYLPERFQVQEHLKTIRDRVTDAKLQIKTFDMKVMTGAIPSFVLLDELHVMSTMSGADNVLTQIRGGFLPRPESLLVIITTQSDREPAGVFRKELRHARAVRDGRIARSRMLPILYEFPEAMQRSDARPWRDPALWGMVNPNLGRGFALADLVALQVEAAEKGVEDEARFVSQHLNVEIGLGLHAERWIGADYWLGATAPGLTLEEVARRSEVCTIGIDGGGLDDLAGLAVIGRDCETGAWLAWTRAWAKPKVLERRKEIADRLRDFAAAGDLVICDKPRQDVEEIADLVEELRARDLLPAQNAVGFDVAQSTEIIQELRERGIAEPVIVSVPQGYRLAQGIWNLERKLDDGTFSHGGQGLMAWCVGNARAETRGNAIAITKETAGKAKIDPLVALFNASMLMGRGPVAQARIDLNALIESRGGLL